MDRLRDEMALLLQSVVLQCLMTIQTKKTTDGTRFGGDKLAKTDESPTKA